MRKSVMRRRLGELEQQLSGARAREAELNEQATIRDLRVADLEKRVRLAVNGCDSALGQLHPMTQAAQQISVIRLALQPEARTITRASVTRLSADQMISESVPMSGGGDRD